MTGRGLHKEVRKAIAEAEQAGLRVVAFSGHTWGQVDCPCGQHMHLAIAAGTLPAAITTAVRHIESLGIAVTGVQSADLVSLRDIAARTGRSYESVRKLAHGQRCPGGFPTPLSTGQWALYSWAEVSAWLARHYPATAAAATSYDREIATTLPTRLHPRRRATRSAAHDPCLLLVP